MGYYDILLYKAKKLFEIVNYYGSIVMNIDKRKRIDEATALIEEARSIVEGVTQEESEAYENMPENLQYSERGELIQEAINNLEYADNSFDELLGYLEEAKQ